jgi:branched-chain amino acid transport system ATP-binding protein
VLRADALNKSFGALTVSRDISLTVAPGARHALIGPNGAGKTTLFNLLTGELAPDSGRVSLDGRDVTPQPPDRRARAGLARSYQRNNLFESMTVRDNLITALIAARGLGRVFWRPLGGLDRDAALLAEKTGVAGALDEPARTLSYGMQRQLEVGLALASDPKVLLLDEPTSGMSPEETETMRGLIAGLPADLAVLIIEHDIDLVLGLADRVTVLDYGTVLFEGTPDEVRASQTVRQRYLGEEP